MPLMAEAMGLPYTVVMGELGDERVQRKIVRYGRAAALVKRMKATGITSH
jgi:hypothetical protein